MHFIKQSSNNVLKALQKSMPKISDTEQQALDAGTVWWERELFSGNPDVEHLKNMDLAQLTDEELDFLHNETEVLCGLLNAWDERERMDLSKEAWDYIKDNGFLGMIIPKEFGGKGFSPLAHSAVVSKVSTASSSGAVSVMVPNSLGPAELLLKYGTDAQKAQYLHNLATGKDIPCFALTSPKAGSDAGGIPDTGVVTYGEYEGNKVLGLEVTWDKRYITLAPVATVLGLAFKVKDPNHLLSKEEDRGITVALIPTDHEGVEIGTRHFPVNQSFMNGPTRGDKVFIPMDFIVGGVDNVGEGWKMLMNCLSEGRAVSLPALATGACKYVARYVGAYTGVREQFGIPLYKMEGIQEKLASIAADAYALEAGRVFTCTALAEGEKPSVASAIMKYYTTERMRQSIDDGMDILGGKGIIDGPSNFLVNAYYAVPVSITVEGANILTRTLMAYGQGALRAHPLLLKELEAIQDDDQKRFNELLVEHLKFGAKNFVFAKSRAWRGYIDKDFGQALKRESAIFSLVSDLILLKLGGALKKNGMLSGKLADVMSELYMISAMIAYAGDGSSTEHVHKYAIERSLFNIEQTMVDILENFPIAGVGKVLKLAFYPLGRRNKKPSHDLAKSVANQVVTDWYVREKLTSGIYITDDENHPAGIQEAAHSAIFEHSELSDEAFDDLINRAVGVDEFDNL